MFRRHPAIILLIVAALLLGGASAVLFARTLVSPLLIIIPSAILAAGVSAYLTRKPEGIASGSPRWLRALAIAFAGAMLPVFLFLIINYIGTDKTSARTEKVKVTGKYYKTRHRNKRVGRRYTPTGEEYRLYYIDLDFGNKTKSLNVDFNRYRTLQQGDSVTVNVASGALGSDVIFL